jgi:hypothetical protein
MPHFIYAGVVKQNWVEILEPGPNVMWEPSNIRISPKNAFLMRAEQVRLRYR